MPYELRIPFAVLFAVILLLGLLVWNRPAAVDPCAGYTCPPGLAVTYTGSTAIGNSFQPSGQVGVVVTDVPGVCICGATPPKGGR